MNQGRQGEATDGSKGGWPLWFFFSDYLPTYLSIYLSIHLSIYPSIHLSIYPSIHLPIYPSIHLTIYLSIYPSIYLSIDLSIYLSLSRSVCLPVYLPVYLQAWKPSYSTRLLHFSKLTDNIKNTALLRDFLIFWSWPHQKRSNSARPPHFLKLTTPRTKQFCETSSIFELNIDNIQNEAILRDFVNFWTWQHQKRSNSARRPSKMESWLQSWRPRANAFCDFSSPSV